MTITILGQLPSGKNQVRTAWTQDRKRPGKMKPHKYPDRRFEAWRSDSYRQILEQYPPARRMTIVMPSRLWVEYWPGDLRTRDLPGMLDALLHLLMYAHVLKDDGLVWEACWNRRPLDRQLPRVVLQLDEIAADIAHTTEGVLS